MNIDLGTITQEDWEIGRKAVEDELVEWRDNRRSVLRRNGLVIAERDGTPSSIIRLPIEWALKIGMEAIAASRNGGTT